MGAEMMQKFTMRRIFTIVALISAGLWVGSATAAPLPVGGSLFPAPAGPPPAGAFLVSTGMIPFADPGAFSGFLVTDVYRGNGFGPLALTFVYTMTSTGGPNNIARLTGDSYTGFLTDARYFASGGVPPTLIDRNTADVVGFSFLNPPVGPGAVPPGATTAVLIVETDAPLFRPAFASVLDGGQATGIATFGPAVPEPASLGLMVLGAGLAIRRRR